MLTSFYGMFLFEFTLVPYWIFLNITILPEQSLSHLRQLSILLKKFLSVHGIWVYDSTTCHSFNVSQCVGDTVKGHTTVDAIYGQR